MSNVDSVIFWLAHAFAQIRGNRITARLNRIIVFTLFVITFAATLGLCIVMSLRTAATSRIIALTGHLVIKAPYATLNTEALRTLFTEEFPEITHAVGYRFAYAAFENSQTMAITPAIIRITELVHERETTELLPPHICINQTDGVYISPTVAKRLALQVGDQVTMYVISLEGNDTEIINFDVSVAGLLAAKGGEDQAALVIMPQELARTHELRFQSTHMAARVASGVSLGHITARLSERLQPLIVSPWYSLTPTLQEALAIEAVAALVGFLLLLLLSGTAIFACCTMLVHSHRVRNELLRQWGASRAKITLTYVTYILLLGFVGVCAGVIATVLFCVIVSLYAPALLSACALKSNVHLVIEPAGIAIIATIVMTTALLSCVSSIVMNHK